jgi:hypothetical protein
MKASTAPRRRGFASAGTRLLIRPRSVAWANDSCQGLSEDWGDEYRENSDGPEKDELIPRAIEAALVISVREGLRGEISTCSATVEN